MCFLFRKAGQDYATAELWPVLYILRITEKWIQRIVEIKIDRIKPK